MKARFQVFVNLAGKIMITDPIADFLIQIQNAARAGKSEVVLPFSKMKLAVANVLKQEGYLSRVEKKGKDATAMLGVELVFDENGTPNLQGTKRISKPSRRVYMGADDVQPVRYGHGLVILSTPEGILTGKQARKKGVGGEVLFEIW